MRETIVIVEESQLITLAYCLLYHYNLVVTKLPTRNGNLVAISASLMTPNIHYFPLLALCYYDDDGGDGLNGICYAQRVMADRSVKICP